MAFPVIQLANKFYALLQRIETGHKSIVWKAVQLLDRPDPYSVRLVEASGRELISYLRRMASSSERSEPPPGSFVALKVAKTSDDEADLRKEAETLRGFVDKIWHQPKSAQVVLLVERSLPTPEMPVMILEWVDGVQVDKLTEPFAEQEGLFVAHQLASALVRIYAANFLVLTDTVKPNSLFWDAEKESLILIDWNILGRPSDFRDFTLPIVGNTLHKILAGKTVQQDSRFRVLSESVGQTPAWRKLTYGSMALVRRALLAEFAGTNPDDLAGHLLNAVTEQWELWDENAETLLFQARSQHGEAAVCRYDLARAKIGRLEPDDEHRMLVELKNVIAAGRDVRNDTALITLSWARTRYPHDCQLRWAWLAHTFARSAESSELASARGVSQVLTLLEHDQFEEAIAALEPLAHASSNSHARALLAEARVWAHLQRGQVLPSDVNVEQAERALTELSAVWKGFLGGEDAFADVEAAVVAYRERVDRIERLKRESIGQLIADDIRGAAAALRNLLAEEPGLVDLPLWIRAVEHLARDEDAHALNALCPTVPTPSSLAEPDSTFAVQIRMIAARRLQDKAVGAASHDCYKAAIAFLEPVERCLPEDQKVRDLLQDFRQKLVNYEHLQAGAKRTQRPEQEIDAWDKWIDAEFNFDTNGVDFEVDGFIRDRSLIKLRFERIWTWAEEEARYSRIEKAIALLRDRAVRSLHAPRAVALLEESVRQDLEERAKRQIRTWKAQQKQLMKEPLEQAKALFDFYVDDQPVRPAEYPRTQSASEMIEELITRARALIQQAREMDALNRDTQFTQDALESFWSGRAALRERDVEGAVSALKRAQRMVHDGLKHLIAPYATVAGLLERALPRERFHSPAIEDAIAHVIRSLATLYDLSRFQADYHNLLEANLLDEWLANLSHSLGEQVSSFLADLSVDLPNEVSLWLKRWQHYTVGGQALMYRSDAESLLTALANVRQGLQPYQVDVPQAHEFETLFDRLTHEIRAECNYDMARALLFDAQSHLRQDRVDLAGELIAEALRLTQDAEVAFRALSEETHSSRQRLVEEVSRLCKDVWQRLFTVTDMPGGLASVYASFDGRPDLKRLADLILSVPDAASVKKAVQMVIDSNAEVNAFASIMGSYAPTESRRYLYSYEVAGILVRAKRYAEALIIATSAADFHPGAQASQPLADALKSPLSTIWEHNLRADNWLVGLDQVYRLLGEDEPDLSTMANAYLSQQPSGDLADQCDSWIKDKGHSAAGLGTVLAAYAPEACRPILYHFDRAATLVEVGHFKAARDLIEAVRKQHGSSAREMTRLGAAIAVKIKLHWDNVFRRIDQNRREAGVALHDGLTGLDPDLFALAQQFGQSPTFDVGQESLLGYQILDAALGAIVARQPSETTVQVETPALQASERRRAHRKPETELTVGQETKPDGERFTALMANVPADKWNTTLRQSLRRALADRYAQQARSIISQRLSGFWLWWRDELLRARILQVEGITWQFDKLSVQLIKPSNKMNGEGADAINP